MVEHVASLPSRSLHQVRDERVEVARARSAARSRRASCRCPSRGERPRSGSTIDSQHVVARLAVQREREVRPDRRRGRWRARTCGRSRSPARRRPSAAAVGRRGAAAGRAGGGSVRSLRRRRRRSSSPPPRRRGHRRRGWWLSRRLRLVRPWPPPVARAAAPPRRAAARSRGRARAGSARRRRSPSSPRRAPRPRRSAPAGIRVRLLADEAVVDLVVPAPGGREDDRGAVDAGLAGRLGGERPCVASPLRIVTAGWTSASGVRPCWSTVMSTTHVLPGSDAGGRRAQRRRSPTRPHARRERTPTAIQTSEQHATHGALLYLRTPPYTAALVEVPKRSCGSSVQIGWLVGVVGV